MSFGYTKRLPTCHQLASSQSQKHFCVPTIEREGRQDIDVAPVAANRLQCPSCHSILQPNEYCSVGICQKLQQMSYCETAPLASPLDLGGEIRAFQGSAVTLKDIFERQATATPKHVALEDAEGKQSLSYKELDELAGSLADLLHSRYGVGPESRVCLAAERTVETMVAMLAILKAGGAYVPLGLRHPDASLRDMIDDISPSVIICTGDSADRFTKVGANPLHVVGRNELAHIPRLSAPLNNTPEPSGDSLAYIIFTSGTTGKPKGVMVPNLSVARYIDSMRQLIEPTQHERVIQIMELTFDSSVFDIWVAWAFGGTVVLCDKWTALEGLADFIRSRNITCLGCTPTQLSLISPQDVPALRVAAIGGEAVPPPLIEKWSRHPSCRIYNQYGPTEASVTVTSIQCKPGMKSPKSIGFANPASVKLYIIDRDGNAVDYHVPGELCIAGPQLARGYFNRPGLTAEKFVTNKFSKSAETAIMYRTGDLCQWLSDGSVEYIGRIDSQVKLRGFRIELSAIESKILESSDIRACAVAIKHRKGPEGTPFLCAYLVPGKIDVDLDSTSLRSQLVASLPDYMIPTAFVTVESIPTDSNGKTDRHQLPDPQPQHVSMSNIPQKDSKSYHSQSCLSTLEKCREIFAEVLGIDAEDVGLDSDFFRLGGQSMSAARLLSLIRQQFTTQIRFAEFFVRPTLGSVVSRVEETTRSGTTDIGVISRSCERRTLVQLASAQSRLYYLYQLDPELPIYNTSAVFDLRGNVDKSRLEDAFRTVVRRHDILRSSYRHDSNGVFQIVQDDAEFSLLLLDLTNCEGQEISIRANNAAAEFSNALFRLDCPRTLPIRALLILLGEDHSRLVISAHHIAMDGLSWEIFYAELSAAFANERLPPLKAQFADFCEWETNFHRTNAYREQLSYWRNEIGEGPTMLELPTARTRPLVGSGDGESLTKRFEGLAASLRIAAAAHATTPFSILLTAYFVLLYRLTGQNDLIVGILSSGRTQPETDKLIGMFVNTLPIKLTVGKDLTFEKLIRQVVRSMSGAFANQDVAFEDLVRQCSHSRHPGKPPLVQTMLTMDDGVPGNDTGGLALKDLEVSELILDGTTTPMFDFSMGCSMEAEDLLVEAEFATDLFDKPSAEQFVDQFESILVETFHSPRQEVTGNWDGLDSSQKRNLDTAPTAYSMPVDSFVELDDSFMEPESTEEVRLARMFCEVLDLPKVDIRQSFFVLGGDSLLSLRLVALARNIGYYINASHVLEFETVKALAEFLLSASSPTDSSVSPPDQEPPCGRIDLTPIQRWFFHESFPSPSHYNQSRLFQMQLDTNAATLEASLLEVVRHHDALRLSFSVNQMSTPQNQHSRTSAARFLSFRSVDASKENFEGLSAEIERETRRDQSSLDIENGPIVVGTLIKCPAPHQPLLSLVIHHLVVDEVSWTVIVDDLNLAYYQLATGQHVCLPLKSHSFAQWTSALRTYSASSALNKEVKYWQHAESSTFKLPLESRLEQQLATDFCEDEISLSIIMSQAEGMHSRETSVKDLLVAALAFSFAELQGTPEDVCILLEGHGREESIARFDLSRTVGWFTSIFPARFDFSGVNTIEDALFRALGCLREIPSSGIGYGLLKYPCIGPSPLSDCHASQVTFNYLGRSTAASAGPARVNASPENTKLIITERDDFQCGSDWDPRNQSDDSILDISCHLVGDCLEMTLRFRPDVLSRYYVQQLADKFATNFTTMSSLSLSFISRLDRISVAMFQSKLKDALRGCWTKHLAAHNSFFGIAVSVVTAGQLLFADGYGYRDASRDVLVDPHTVFSLGSAGKPIVSFLAAVLVDEYVVDLDAPLAKLLNEANILLPNVYGRMTLRQLLTMTAGVPFVDSHLEETVDDPFAICARLEVTHEPGTHYFYSNFSYALAGYFLALSVGVKEGITDFKDLAQLFLRLIEEKVLMPVGMNDAKPEAFQLLSESRATVGLDHIRNEVGSASMLPSGPVKTSVCDTAKFLITEYQRGVSPSRRRIVPEDRISERFDISHSLGYDWGMGWFRDRNHGFLHASGQWADAVSGLMLDPDTGFGLSFICSVRDSTHLNVLEMDMDRLFIEFLGAIRQQGKC